MSVKSNIDPRNQKLDAFLNDLASSKPAPGGGSAAAVAGALGAALSSMVANLTLGKEKYKEVEGAFETILEKAEKLRNEFLRAIGEDIEAYNEVMDAYGLPKNTEEEKERRREAIQSALKGATEPPFKMAELADEVLELSKECALSGNSHAVTDAGASAILAEATVRTALLNVDINLSSISDSSFVEEKRRKRKDLSQKARRRAEEVVEIMDGKI
ncbi:MAG: cyclodeaminase/cyclohydrolase family protein [Candidatus Bipolaricaulota bacterium]|nr:cyclodeaminase/cyclohydrolase family protein [Candidatus Bipolaricaulota bacterium]